MIPRSPSVSEGVLEPNEPEPFMTTDELHAELARRTLDLWLKGIFSPADSDDGDAA